MASHKRARLEQAISGDDSVEEGEIAPPVPDHPAQAGLPWPFSELITHDTLEEFLCSAITYPASGEPVQIPSIVALKYLRRLPATPGQIWYSPPKGFQAAEVSASAHITLFSHTILGLVPVEAYNGVCELVSAGYVHRWKSPGPYVYLPALTFESGRLRGLHILEKLSIVPAQSVILEPALQLTERLFNDGNIPTVINLSSQVAALLAVATPEVITETAKILQSGQAKAQALDTLASNQPDQASQTKRALAGLGGVLVSTLTPEEKLREATAYRSSHTAKASKVFVSSLQLGYPVTPETTKGRVDASTGASLAEKALDALTDTDWVGLTARPATYDQLASAFSGAGFRVTVFPGPDVILATTVQSKGGKRKLTNPMGLQAAGITAVRGDHLKAFSASMRAVETSTPSSAVVASVAERPADGGGITRFVG